MNNQLPVDDALRTARLVLVPVTAADADEMAAIFADERVYQFTGGEPGTVESLRQTLGQLAENRAAGTAAQLNWVVRRLVDGAAIGMLQAVLSRGSQAAEVSWLVGVPWQGQGFASEAAIAVVAWLEARGVEQVTAWIRPDHHALSRSLCAPASWSRTRPVPHPSMTTSSGSGRVSGAKARHRSPGSARQTGANRKGS